MDPDNEQRRVSCELCLYGYFTIEEAKRYGWLEIPQGSYPWVCNACVYFIRHTADAEHEPAELETGIPY